MAGDSNGTHPPATRNGVGTKLGFGKGAAFDQGIYGGSRRSDYVTELPGDADQVYEDEDAARHAHARSNPVDKFSAPAHLMHEYANDDEDPLAGHVSQNVIANRESDYHRRRFDRQLGEGDTDYATAMRKTDVEREEQRVKQILQDRARREADKAERQQTGNSHALSGHTTPVRNDRDVTPPWDGQQRDKTPTWDGPRQETPPPPGKTDDTSPAPGKRKRRWDLAGEELPPPAVKVEEEAPRKKRRSRWDDTPIDTVSDAISNSAAPEKKSRWDTAPVAEPMAPPPPVTLGGMTDEELDALLPSEGYEIVTPPPGYEENRLNARARMAAAATAAPTTSGGFMMQDDNAARQAVLDLAPELPTDVYGVGQVSLKKEDAVHFGKILKSTGEEEDLSVEELKERKIMRLLLKIKNGTPAMRKVALRQLTDRTREFGAKALFAKILPLLMERSLEDQERHLLVKVVDRVLNKLDDLVRPHVHEILVVIEPLLIEEDRYARIEGKEIISNLSKAAGLAHMIKEMRPDIDSADEYVRNTTARAFSVVASALGIPALLPFLRAVCRSKRSWQARHTGTRIVQQIAIMSGCAILPHLKNLVDCVEPGLRDEQNKVKTMTALALSALAEAAAPYGIESFEGVLKPLLEGVEQSSKKSLAAFLRAFGYIIPLMDSDTALPFVKEISSVLVREFHSADDEMRRIVLQVVQQCAATDGVTGQFLKAEIMPEFFKAFWIRRLALDRRTATRVVTTTVELANKVGVSEIVGRITKDLKDENEPFRKMVVEAIDKVVGNLGAADIDQRLEEELVDGLTYAFQEQSLEDSTMLEGIATVINALGIRIKPYLPQISAMIQWRLNNKDPKTRQQAADLVAKLAVVMKECDEDEMLGRLGVVLYEEIGEEFPEALASIITAITAISNVLGMTAMRPPIKDLLPSMTPILRNRHEKVQEASIQLIGRIADRGAEYVAAREWMRICFELLDLLKAHKQAIRRAAVNSFGYIAKAIGPQDVLQVLLTNLRVQERQSRVCSTVAIAIVAETTGPFITIPYLLNEYRQPELNVRTGVLKALSFVFEYIGEMGKDYVYSVLGALEDALTDRDHVHRQTAASIVKHLALGVAGLGQEDSMQHLLNLVWPNIFELSPHVIGAVMEAVEAMRVALGPGVLLNYTLQGLFHPARKVRNIYVRTYNTNYLGAQPALVPFYPNMQELSDERNDYTRHELMALL